MIYNIGDRIQIKAYKDLPEVDKTKGKARVCGKSGKVIDALTKETGERVYMVHLDGYKEPSKALYSAEAFTKESGIEYAWTFEVLENVVVGIMYEVKGNQKTEVCRGHGHIIHEGVLGIAQAASYALKKAYEKLDQHNSLIFNNKGE